MAEVFSEQALIESWLTVERELAAAQGELGLIPDEAAAAICRDAVADRIDFTRLWADTRSVGYPIVPLIEQVAAHSSPLVGRYIHWAATTQDVMDTGLVLQLRRASQRLEGLEEALGNELSKLADAYRSVPMAARTHAQQAVPTTFGAKLAVWLDEFTRHLERLREVVGRLLVVQLFGAGGTAAAFGPQARNVRHRLAERLELGATDVPWHTARDRLAEFGFVLASAASTCGKIAREITELSRTEIGEVREHGGPTHGSSSTMPQKANPCLSEAIVGLNALARDRVAALLTAMQGTHERSTGEWQIEWDALPTLCALSAACLANTRIVLENLRVFPEQMGSNLGKDGGLVMAEAAMMALAPTVGRLQAHELVRAASQKARERDQPFAQVLVKSLDASLLETIGPLDTLLAPTAYLGETDAIVAAAMRHWEQRRSRPR
jgi:3-carboxy-cis,cis-muconate cycloisomerase